MTAPEILQKIVNDRRRRIAEHGFDMGCKVPEQRNSEYKVQGVRFSQKPFVICEVKRRSPSRGNIRKELDPVAQAELYKKSGITSVSVLTEQDHFSGSLNDLIAIKNAFPDLALLRKDFLLTKEDIDVSYRAGADAVLLIAAILEPEKLAELYMHAQELGLAALVEVHNEAELNRVVDSGVEPRIMGINARNLNTFQVDLLAPLRLRKSITWPCDVVFESGIFAPEQAMLVREQGFSGLLVGEAAVRRPELPRALSRMMADKQADKRTEDPAGELTDKQTDTSGVKFWTAVNEMLSRQSTGQPLVKICGITNEQDAQAAVEAGAHMLGFVFADSPRRADVGLLSQVKNLNALKIAVVTQAPESKLVQAFENGLIDAFQYHGDESPEQCMERGLPYYKALRLKDQEMAADIMDYAVPRVLVDAWSAEQSGGTGKRLKEVLVTAAAERKPLWLAGGLNPENIQSIIRQFKPELIDASSGLESEPGRKDMVKMQKYFEEIRSAGV